MTWFDNYSWQDGHLSNSNLFITLIVLLFITALFLIFEVLFFLKFKKINTKDKFYNKSVLSFLFAISVLALFFAILSIIFFYGERMISTAKTAAIITLVFALIPFVLIIINIAWIFPSIYSIAVAFDEEAMWGLGENIQYKKIISIVKDTKSGKVFINYKSGLKSFKKEKINPNNVAGQFVIERIEKITGLKIEEKDQLEYFKGLIEGYKIEQIEKLKQKQLQVKSGLSNKEVEKAKPTEEEKTVEKAKPTKKAKPTQAEKSVEEEKTVEKEK